MTGLLVSVRNDTEAAAAVAGGADLIDIKEPRLGSLGAASEETWDAVKRVVAGRVPLSAALGELLEWDNRSLEKLTGFKYAKLGLAGCGGVAGWSTNLGQAACELPAGVASVAVIYADWQQAMAPSPEEILQQTARQKCAAVLLDTYGKVEGHLLDLLSESQIAAIASEVRRQQLKFVIAGSLNAELLPRVLPFDPDYVAIRGAVCRGDRTTAIHQELVAEFAKRVHAENMKTFSLTSQKQN